IASPLVRRRPGPLLYRPDLHQRHVRHLALRRIAGWGAWRRDADLTDSAATDDAPCVIRPARGSEIDAVLAMFEWLFEPPGYTPRWWDERRARRELAEAIKAGDSTVLVAEVGRGRLEGGV